MIQGAIFNTVIKKSTGGVTPPPDPTYDFSRLAVKYNNVDFAYTTSSADFSDTGTIVSGSNLISMTTVVPDLTSGQTEACTGIGIDQSDPNGNNDCVIIKRLLNSTSYFFKRNDVPLGTSPVIPTINRSIAGGGGQGMSFDSNTQYEYDRVSGGRIRAIDLSGNLIEELNLGEQQGMLCYAEYGPLAGSIFITKDGGELVNRYIKSGGQWNLAETYWFSSNEGGAVDYVNNKFVNNASGEMREQTFDGFNVRIWPKPLASLEDEGFAVDPRDGTFWFCSDDKYHGNITNGNRLVHCDPRGLYRKFLRFPDMIRYNKFKIADTIVGALGGQKINGNKFNISPVIDFQSFTGQQTLANWTSAEVCDLEFRGSASAPTTTSENSMHLDIYDANQSNDGWGATVPGSWQSTPTTGRYLQFRIKPKVQPVVPPSFLPSDLGTSLFLWSESKTTDALYYRSFESNQVAAMLNRKNPSIRWNQSTTGQRPLWDSTNNFIVNNGSNRHFILTSIAEIMAMSECEVHCIMSKVAATSTCYYLTASNSATAVGQIRLQHLGSGSTYVNAISMQYIDAAGNNNVIGIADTSFGNTFKFVTYQLGLAGGNKIRINTVDQPLTVFVGANSGFCFDDIAATVNTVRAARIQGSTGASGAQNIRGMFITGPLTDQQRTDLYNYAVSKGLLS